VALLGPLAAAGVPVPPVLPKVASTYLNLSSLRQRGLEASIEHTFTDHVSAFANYSYQRTPELLTPDSGQIQYPTGEVTVPAKNRFNAGINLVHPRFLGSASVNYADKSFWTDVLDSTYDAYSPSYTMVNASFGVKWAEGKVTTMVKGTNLFNKTIQQHTFGDIIKRSVYAEVRFSFK
jgi:outer membrane receptor protein involved in Fe transport